MVDLEGRAIGIALARAGRIKSFIIPASRVQQILTEEPAKPRPQDLAGGERKPARGLENEDPFEVMRRKMEEMRKLMREIERMEK